jgi:hypothetical protein
VPDLPISKTVTQLPSPSKAKATKKTFTITEIVKENMDPNAKGEK